MPGPGQVRVQVLTCGVCRTDLHVLDGDLPVHRPAVVPGHEVVGIVDAFGAGTSRFAVGDRIGIPWLGHTCGVCRFCRNGRENLCIAPTFTGWDVDGGYAPYAIVDEAYAYAIPPGLSDEQAAPLLCAGIIGYRAYQRARVPEGGRLGIWGFGGSAHLTAQIAIHDGASVYAFTRGERARTLAASLGASVDPPDEPLDSAILFAPAGELVPVALEALGPGGTLAIAGIHLSDVPPLNYQRHLFEERTVCSVTANTRVDGNEFLELAADIPVRVVTTPYDFTSAPTALDDLRGGQVDGAAVLHMV